MVSEGEIRQGRHLGAFAFGQQIVDGVVVEPHGADGRAAAVRRDLLLREAEHRVHQAQRLSGESPEGVENAEEIYSLPGCDAIFVGPNDLRFQMRAPDGTFPSGEEHEAMIQRVIEIGKKVGTPTGIHAMDPTSARDRADQGMQFLAIGSDLRMMTIKAQEVISELDPAEEAKDLARY